MRSFGQSNQHRQNDDLYLLTFKNAPRYKIIRTKMSNPDLKRAEVIVPESKSVIERLSALPDALYVQVLDGGIRKIYRVDYKTHKRDLFKLPYPGSATLAFNDYSEKQLNFYVDSWTKSASYFQYGSVNKTMLDPKLIPPVSIDMSDIEFVNVFAKSHDGVLVPMVIIHKKGIPLDGSILFLMDGYGSYGTENISPFFFTKALPWLERGGIFVWTGVRGGGEYGEEWHQAGMQKTKPNTWKDFIACAEYLIKNRYTSPAKLGIQGGSAGGILISNAIAERPELFGAAIINVGVNNPLLFETTANGIANIAEFGTYKTEEGFKSLLAMMAI